MTNRYPLGCTCGFPPRDDFSCVVHGEERFIPEGVDPDKFIVTQQAAQGNTMDTCAEWTRANAYIVRHGLWYKQSNHRCIVAEDLNKPQRGVIVGHGTTLYQAVLDYQRKSGIGWGS